VSERILIVDDNEPLCAILAEELEEAGYAVDTASDGRAGVTALREIRYDLVILDLRMPVMDGLEALGKMLAQNRHTPIVIHSAYSSYQEDFRTWSADAYVIKSGDSSRLKATIREVLDERRRETPADGTEES